MYEQTFNDLITIDFDKKYNTSDSDILKEGYLAGGMDEKWNIIFEENTLNIYRSWTGRGIFKIEFYQNGDELVVRKAFIEKDFVDENPKEKGYYPAFLNWIIEFVVFGRVVDMPK